VEHRYLSVELRVTYCRIIIVIFITLRTSVEDNISVVVENNVKREFVMLHVPVTEKWKL